MDILRQKKRIFFCLFLIVTQTVHAQELSENDDKKLTVKKMEKTDYIPRIHGTIRGKYEYASTLNAHRFQVRNARVELSGNVHPIVAYRAEIDLSDAGVTKMLNAYVRIFPAKGLSFTLGQMKVPFSTDNLRSPHTIFFANRSFLAKQISNLRDVGLKARYEWNGKVPFSILASIYNGSGIYNQNVWKKQMNYATRFTLGNPDKYLFSVNAEAQHPDESYMYLYDAGFYCKFFGFHAEIEYLYKDFQANRFKPVQALNAFLNYDLPLPKAFKKISFLVRYDIMTDNSKGYNDELGILTLDQVGRQRVTGGITLSINKPFIADIRINYEKYFYENWTLADQSEQDKLVFELVARF